MKKVILKPILVLCFILNIFTYCKAQILVNGKKANQYTFRGQFEKEDYERLKNSTIYYMCSPNVENIELLETEIKKAWTYSKIEVISLSEFGDHENEENAAFFSLGINRTVNEIISVYMNLWCYKMYGKNKGYLDYAKINLMYDCEVNNVFKKDIWTTDNVFEYLFKTPDPDNLKAGILPTYLMAIQETLESQKKLEDYETIIKKDKLKKLKDETIYITENVVLKEICHTEKWDLKELMSKCPFKYKIISYEELNEKLLNNEPIVFILANRVEIQRRSFFMFDNRTKECLYKVKAGGRGGFWARDFELLGKLILKE